MGANLEIFANFLPGDRSKIQPAVELILGAIYNVPLMPYRLRSSASFRSSAYPSSQLVVIVTSFIDSTQS